MIFGNCNIEEKEIEIQLGFDPRSYECWSEVLTTEPPSPGIVWLNLTSFPGLPSFPSLAVWKKSTGSDGKLGRPGNKARLNLFVDFSVW